MHLEARGDAIHAEMTEAELVLLSNALNEVCNGIDIREFATRLGAPRDDAKWLLREILEFLRRNEA